MSEFKTYNFKGKIGYLGDFETEWWTEADWENYRKRVQELKEQGLHGKETEVDMTVVPHPDFDNPSKGIDSWKMKIIDFGN